MSHNAEIQKLKEHLKNLPRLGDKDREKRIKKASEDFWFFIRTYFPHHIEDAKKETSEFRKFLHKNLSKLINENRQLIFEAYRGSAKTTTISRLALIWLMVTRRKRYAVLISSTLDVAKETIETVMIELEDNENLRSDFELAEGEPWTTTEFILRVKGTLCKVKVGGAGKKIRGANFLAMRPDLIILDDIENDENVETPIQRNKLYRWFNKAIKRLPSRTSTTYNIIVVGTRLHHDGLTARLAKRNDFQDFCFPLVIDFPRELNALTKDNLNDIKLTGYKLDDPRIDIRAVMIEYLEDRESFYSELQMQPISAEALVFSNYQTFASQTVFDAIYIGIDPALGKTKGDYFAVATLLRHDKRYYASATGYKQTPEKMIPILIELFIRLSKYEVPIKIAIETVAFQEFFKTALKQEAAKRYIHLPVVEIKNKVAKELRIDSLSPYINDGTILIDEQSHLLIDELTTYPKAAHDDLLDAVEMAFRIASRRGVHDYKLIERVMKNYEFSLKGEIL